MGGLFVKTPEVKPVESVVNLHFLAQEGQIRADATVRYARLKLPVTPATAILLLIHPPL